MIQTVFPSLDTMWYAAVNQLLNAEEVNSRDGGTLEMVGYQATISDPSRCWVHNPRRAVSPFYAAGEILWYASGGGDLEMIQSYAPSYARHAEDNGELKGAYGTRLNECGGLVYQIVQALKSDPDTRRGVVSIWHPVDLYRGHGKYAVKDVPCTLMWQFMIRYGRLTMITTMRSQDVWLGMPYDVFWNCLVQRLIANELGIAVGTYIHQCGSLHLYDRNNKAAQECLKHVPLGVDAPSFWRGATDTWHNLRTASQLEKAFRKNSRIENTSAFLPSASRSLLTLCRSHLSGYRDVPLEGIDPALAKAAEVFFARKDSK